jgi:hypothetical protein
MKPISSLIQSILEMAIIYDNKIQRGSKRKHREIKNS